MPQRDCVLRAVHRSTSICPQSEIVPHSSGISVFSTLTHLQTRNEVPCHPVRTSSQWLWQNSSQLPPDATLNATLRHPTVAHPKLSQALDFLAFPPNVESISLHHNSHIESFPYPWTGHIAPATARYYLSIPKSHSGASAHLLSNTTLTHPFPLHFIPLLVLSHNSIGHPSSRTRADAWKVRLRSM